MTSLVIHFTQLDTLTVISLPLALPAGRPPLQRLPWLFTLPSWDTLFSDFLAISVTRWGDPLCSDFLGYSRYPVGIPFSVTFLPLTLPNWGDPLQWSLLFFVLSSGGILCSDFLGYSLYPIGTTLFSEFLAINVTQWGDQLQWLPVESALSSSARTSCLVPC